MIIFDRIKSIKMKKEDFEKLVEEAVMALPEHIRNKIENAVIVVEQRPSGEQLEKTGTKIESFLLGLYEGIPKTAWGRDFSGRLPDKITIFQEPIEKLGHSSDEIKELVKYTVWHEIAHHFGFNERRIRLLETKWRKRR
jgi:predicted Zn-dependent protease with MMP-like domain